MTDYEMIKDVFSRGEWDIEESIINENDSESRTLKKLHLGGYYGFDVFFKENGEIDNEC